MRLIPVVTVKDGRPVRTREGAARGVEPWPPPYPDGGDDLVGLLRHLFSRFGAVVVEDLGEGRYGDAHRNLYQRLMKQHVEVWVRGHSRRLEDVMDHFVSGAHAVIVDLDRIEAAELDETLELVEGETFVAYAVEDEHTLIRSVHDHDPRRWTDNGAAGIVLDDRTGRLDGLQAAWLRHVDVERVPVYVRTETSSPAQVERLLHEGARGVLVGGTLLRDLDAYATLAKRLRADDDTDEDDEDPEQEGPGSDRAAGTPRADIRNPRRSLVPGLLPSRGRIEMDEPPERER